MKKEKPKNNPAIKRTGYPTLISQDVRKIARNLLGKEGFATADIIADWQAVAGEKISECSVPLKIKFPRGKNQGGTLHILVAGGGFVQYISYQKPVILEKVNQYFGYDAVSDLKIIPGLYTRKNNAESEQVNKQSSFIPADNDVDDSESTVPISETLKTVLDGMEDGDLKQHLLKLAKMYIKRQ